MTYELEFPSELRSIHPVSMSPYGRDPLKFPPQVVQMDDMQVEENLWNEEGDKECNLMKVCGAI